MQDESIISSTDYPSKIVAGYYSKGKTFIQVKDLITYLYESFFYNYGTL